MRSSLEEFIDGRDAVGRAVVERVATRVTARCRGRADQFDPALFDRVAHLVQERVATLGEVPAMVSFFFLDDVPFDDAAFDKTIANDAVGPSSCCRSAIDAFATVEWNADDVARGDAAAGGVTRLGAAKESGADSLRRSRARRSGRRSLSRWNC